MNASSVPTIGPNTILDSQDLTSYAFFTHFNLFLFSRTADDVPVFLLDRSSDSFAFNSVSGASTIHDPIIPFAVIRELITRSRGLLSTYNHKYFLATNKAKVQADEILLDEDISSPVRPQKGLTRAMDDICKQLCDTPYLFQNASGVKTYFVEIPLLNTETLNDAASQLKIDFEARYFSLEEIMDVENNEIAHSLRRSFNDSRLTEYTEKFIVNCEPIEITGHYAMIGCDPTSNTYMMPVLHFSIFKKHGECWRYYKAYEGELPTNEDLKKIKGILIPGSSYSAYQQGVWWYNKYFEFVRNVVHNHKNINILAICFGAQSMAQALGGRVEKMNNEYVRGGDALRFRPSFYEHEVVKNLDLDADKTLVIAESHGDHIAELPPGAVLQASSKTTNVEIYTIGKNIIALQGHPEYNEIWTAGAHYRINRPDVDDYDTYAKEYMREKFPSAVCQKELLSVCFGVLKQ